MFLIEPASNLSLRGKWTCTDEEGQDENLLIKISHSSSRRLILTLTQQEIYLKRLLTFISLIAKLYKYMQDVPEEATEIVNWGAESVGVASKW